MSTYSIFIVFCVGSHITVINYNKLVTVKDPSLRLKTIKNLSGIIYKQINEKVLKSMTEV